MVPPRQGAQFAGHEPAALPNRDDRDPLFKGRKCGQSDTSLRNDQARDIADRQDTACGHPVRTDHEAW